MKCERCAFWIVARVTRYAGNDAVIENYRAPSGRGRCDKLNMETEADFGCTKFLEDDGDHVEVTKKAGEPWHHFVMGNCPDCRGKGSGAGEKASACNRCAGTGQVRFYDDGYVGEEQTRLHPNEKAGMPPPPTPDQQRIKELEAQLAQLRESPLIQARANAIAASGASPLPPPPAPDPPAETSP